MAEARTLRAVFFDVGGTLVRPRLPMGEVVVRKARAAGVSINPDDEIAIARRLGALVAERSRGREAFTYPPERSRRRWTRIYRAGLEGVCPSGEAEQIAEAVWRQLSSPAAYEVYPDALPTLRTLSNVGLVLGVVSNWEAWLPHLLEHLGISRLLACAITSGEAEVEKPDVAIFTAALRAVGLEPDEAVHVGDSVTDDVAGAIGAGMRAVLLDRSKTSVGVTAAPAITTLNELPMLVESWQPTAGAQTAGVANASARFRADGRSTR